ncbi:MAG: hypothetical protein OXC28_05005 [Defluviicoccus sp.]|nr:hypothetical protein [Defluviicoccus sp.]
MLRKWREKRAAAKRGEFTPEQKEVIEAMITNRLHLFHEALVERGQIEPTPMLEISELDSVTA